MEPRSPVLSQRDVIYLTELTQNDDFKKNVCIPYFKDIFKVSSSLITVGPVPEVG